MYKLYKLNVRTLNGGDFEHYAVAVCTRTTCCCWRKAAAGEKLLLAKPSFIFVFIYFKFKQKRVQSVPRSSLELYANWGDVICAHAYVYERDVRVSCACVCVFSNSMKKPEGHLASRFGSVA